MTEAAAETEIRSYFITVWTMEGGGGVERPSERPLWSVKSKSLKEIVNTWVCCADPVRDEGERSSNKQMNFSQTCA